jgi:hypothetical protein
VADVPFMETILHRNVASRWDGIVCENVSIEPDKRWRLGVYTDDNDPGASTNKANTHWLTPITETASGSLPGKGTTTGSTV